METPWHFVQTWINTGLTVLVAILVGSGKFFLTAALREAREEARSLLDTHNLAPVAHPNLVAVDRLERKLDELTKLMNEVSLKLERITPRRRRDDPDGEE